MKRLVPVALLVILFGALLFLVVRPAQPAPVAPVIVMPLPYRIPPQKVSLFDRWAPRQPAWNWLWRLREKVQGRRRVCDLRATVVDFAGSGTSFLTNHPLPTPAFTDAKGLKIWLLSDDEMSALGRDLRQASGTEVLFMPGITTADGMQAQLSTGSTVPIMGVPTMLGLVIDFVAHVRPNATDVTTIISLTDAITNQPSMIAGSPSPRAPSIQTNFAVAARLQIPKSSGVFLLQGAPAAADQKGIGVLFAVTISPPKK